MESVRTPTPLTPAIPEQRKLLVTSALPYANGQIHLGHLLEHIQTDIWVRFQRMRGHECHYICADDAHGTAIMLKAETEGVTPEALIEKVKAEHIADFEGFHISYDHYHSTHSKENRALSQMIYRRLKDQGCILEKEITQLFDPEKQLFLSDRFIKGTCPKCKTPDQYGDNCEACGATYQPSDLIEPHSALSGATPILKNCLQLYFDLPRFESVLDQWLNGEAVRPEVANKLREWLNMGLKPWDISREAPYFGFEIPGYTDKFFYVWLDAPIGYLASFQYLCEHKKPSLDFDTYWQPESRCEVIHFIGKDIINFHGLFWPAMLSGANLRLPTRLQVHGFVNINGEKMSKSRGTFITAARYLKHLSPEYLRYYYACKLSNGIEDIDLNLEDFASRVNSDLVGKFVNIASRCAGFIHKRFEATLAPSLSNPELIEALQQQAENIAALYESCQYSKAMREISQLADQTNTYIDQSAPWKMVKDPATCEQAHGVCSTGLNAFRLLALYLKPVLPQTVAAAEQFLNIPPLTWQCSQATLLGHTINPFTPLMQRITPEQIQQLLDTGSDQ